MARFTVTADGKSFEFDAPANADAEQIRTLAARALKQGAPNKEYQRPVLERRITDMLAKPKDEIRATPWSLSNAISDKVTGVLSAFGMDEGKARRFADKATSALTDLTPVGAAVEADQARHAEELQRRINELKPAAEFEGYRRLAGETEARNVQTRLDYTPELRALRPPWNTQDYPNADQFVIWTGK